jgi:beta-ureidopropionase / N-carbamoyl-L-amino-acid hydrolase
VGRFNVEPNAPSVVASKVTFSIDLRHPEQQTLERLGDGIASICASSCGPCSVRVTDLVNAPSLEFPPGLRDRIRQIAQDLGMPAVDIPSLAGHDARQLHYVAPSGMIFIPCREGISHNEAEWAEPLHLAHGAQVLAEMLVALTA